MAGILLFIAVVAREMSGPANFSIRFRPCDAGWCVSEVAPSAIAWQDGARVGMRVVSVDDQPIHTLPAGPPATFQSMILKNGDGGTVRTTETPYWLLNPREAYSLWGLAIGTTLLGAIVIARRPGDPATWCFAAFALTSSVALAITPVSTGPRPFWSIGVQQSGLIWLAASLVPLVTTLVGHRPISRAARLGFFILLAGTIVTEVTHYAGLLEWMPWAVYRGLFALYFSLATLYAIGILLVRSLRSTGPQSKVQARIVLLGFLAGGLPLLALTIVPDFLGFDVLIKTFWAALGWGFIPAAFAYALLRHELLGIRRAIDRGIVLGTAGVILLLLLAVAVGLIATLPGQPLGTPQWILVVALLVLAGSAALPVLTRRVRRWLGATIYGEILDYDDLVESVGGELTAARATTDAARLVCERLVDALRLESAILFLGEDPAAPDLVADAGERAAEVRDRLQPRLASYREHTGGLVELAWEAENLLLAPMTDAGRPLAWLLLGPKRAGETFVREERQLVATLTPILGLALHKSRLSEDLRDLNRRLIKAEESERARVAQDLHDGPLQKAVLLGREGETRVRDPQDLARQLVADLREVCARLRPSVLDDLGLVSALEWLVEGVAVTADLALRIEVEDVEVDERFPPDAELALFRIAQESINNTLKHANAAAVEVRLSRQDHALVLEVCDDGAGFAADAVSGLGLPGMRERALAIGGTLEVESSPGRGTRIVATVPLTFPAEASA